MQKKIKTIILITIFLTAVIIIALFAAVKILITPERVRAILIPEIEKSLNRKADIGNIEIGLFKGIEVNDFLIKEEDGKTDFVTCRDFLLKYKLLPLLSRKVVIDELKLVSPKIRIARDKDGRFNYEGIGRKSEEEKKKGKDAAEKKALPVSLLINKIKIEDGGISFSDRRNELPDIKSSVDMDVSVKEDGPEIASHGRLDLKLDEIVIKRPFEKGIKDISSQLKYAIRINPESKTVHIESADLKVHDASAVITGDIKDITGTPVMALKLSIPSVKVDDIYEVTRPLIGIKGLNLSGNVSADLNLSGEVKKPDSLKTSGKVMLQKVGISYNNVNAILEGGISFAEEKMDFDIIGTVGKNTANLKGSVRDYLKNQKIHLNLYSKQLLLDEIVPAGADKETAPQGRETTPEKTAAEAKPVNLKLRADGEIKIGSLKYRNAPINDFHAVYGLKSNIFEVSKMTASIGKGRLNMNGNIDLSAQGYTYNLSSSIDSVHIDEIINILIPKAKDTVFGTLSSNLKLNGAGTLPENIKKNLIGEGDFNVKDGKITNSNISSNLAMFLNIEELKTINLKEANGRVKIKNGAAKLESVFSSDDIYSDPSGKISLLNETLDLAFDLKLSPRLTTKISRGSNIASYIKDEKGWGRIPLKVSGTFSNPSYNVDMEKAGKRVVEKKVMDLLEKDKKKGENKKPGSDILKWIFK